MPVEPLTPARRRERTRATLIEAAAEVFAETGFAAASLGAIAERAGYSRAAVYPYFATKYDLLTAAIDEYTARFMARHKAVIEAEGATLEPEDAVEKWAAAHEGEGDVLNLLLLELRLHALRHPDDRPRAIQVERRMESAVVERITEQYRAAGREPDAPVEDLAALNEIVSIGIRVRASVLGIDPKPLYLRYQRLIHAPR